MSNLDCKRYMCIQRSGLAISCALLDNQWNTLRKRSMLFWPPRACRLLSISRDDDLQGRVHVTYPSKGF